MIPNKGHCFAASTADRGIICQPPCSSCPVLPKIPRLGGRYGGCRPGCGSRGPFCGDAVTENGVEQCDDGRNLSTYNQSGCAPGCKTAPRCGDMRVDSLWGETCDDGNTASDDGCNKSCQLVIE